MFIPVALLVCAAVSSAHQPYESSAVGRLDGERLELTVTTSAEIAGMLVGEPMVEAVPLENLCPQLLKVGAELYEVTATGEPLQPERVFFTEKGGEAVFSVIYPVVRPAELRFQAAYLDNLPPGYGASIKVVDEAGNLLGRELRLKKGEAKDTFSVQVPAAISRPVGTPVNSPAPTEAVQQSSIPIVSEPSSIAPKHNPRLSLLIGICAVLTLAVLVVMRQCQRSRN